MPEIWTTTKLSLNELQLECLPGIGGRLWDVKFQGRSLLFQNPDLIGNEVNIGSLPQLPTRSPQFGFPLWGGEKTWIAPDKDWPNDAPYPVLDSAPYNILSTSDRHLAMQSQICPNSLLQIERRITIEASCSWSIHHSVVNHGDSSKYLGIWSVLMLKRPAKIGLNTGNEAKFTPIFGDADDHYETQRQMVVIDCSSAKEFKLGMNTPSGRVFLRLAGADEDVWLMCSTPLSRPNDKFAHEHNFEVFNSGDYPYCEAEWHSPAKLLEPGETIRFTQDFSLWTEISLSTGNTINPRERKLVKCMS